MHGKGRFRDSFRRILAHFYRGLSLMLSKKFLPVLFISLLLPVAASGLPAFPGAAGFGSDATGGSVRAGAGKSAIMRITNLDDAGTGSLRACIDASGPRICVFEVGGYITLNSPLVIRNNNITIAGQTAPAPGVHLRNGGNKGSVMQTRAGNIIIQHIGIRAGDDGCTVGTCDQRRALEVNGGSNMIFDHLSLTWGIDETFDTYANSNPTNFTVSNTLIGENLRHSFHSKNRTSADGHSYGTMFNTVTGSDIKATFSGNLLTGSYYRNPLLKSGWNLEFINNVVYGWGGGSSDTMYQQGSNNLIFAGNYYKKASWSARSNCLTGSDGIVYAPDGSNSCPSSLGTATVSSAKFAPSNAAHGYNDSPADTLTEVFGNVGMRPWDRYSADKRMIDEARNGTGGFKDCVNQCGQGMTNVPVDPSGRWPGIQSTKRALALPSGPDAIQSSGYSKIEEWLFGFLKGDNSQSVKDSTVQPAGTVAAPKPEAAATPSAVRPGRKAVDCAVSVRRKNRKSAVLNVDFSEKVLGFSSTDVKVRGAKVKKLKRSRSAAAYSGRSLSRFILVIKAGKGSRKAVVSVPAKVVKAAGSSITNRSCGARKVRF